MPPRIPFTLSIRTSPRTQLAPSHLRFFSTTLGRRADDEDRRPPISPISSTPTPTPGSTATTTTTTTTAPAPTATPFATEQSPFGGLSRPAPGALRGGGAKERPGLAKYIQKLTDETQERQAYRQSKARNAQELKTQANERKRAAESTSIKDASDELMSLMGLRLQAGDVYSPHDLTPGEMRHYIGKKALGRGTPPKDEIAETGVNPLDLYCNFTLIEQWRTSAGRIKHSKDTGFSPVNQRKVAKAVRRAIGLALVPSTHAHPEILARELQPVSSLAVKVEKKGSITWMQS